MSDQKVIATITFIKFENKQSNYCIVNGKVEEENSTSTFVGYAQGLVKGLKYEFIGSYCHDRKWGVQFKFNSVSLYENNGRQSIIHYLASSAFKGIGIVTATHIVDTLGNNCINQILQDPLVLDQCDLSEKQTASILTTLFASDKGFNSKIDFLCDIGFNLEQAQLVYQHYKESTEILLKEDPFIPYYQLNEIDYHTCEIVASNLNFEASDDVVIISKLYQQLLKLCQNSGSTYIHVSEFQIFGYKKLNLDEVDFYRLIQEGINRGWFILEEERLYLATSYYDECEIANYLSYFPYDGYSQVDDSTMNQCIQSVEDSLNIHYDSLQIQAIKAVINQDLTFITGGPGTGKTTITKAIVSLCKNLYHTASIVATAPTGRAAKRLSEVLGIHSTTLHSLLSWDKHSNTFRKDENNPISVEILIIDECSMVDNHLFSALCKAGRELKKIIFIGDAYQLPSVGVGNLFADLMQCYPKNVITLQTNYRQAKENSIVNLANHIVKGYVKKDDFINNARFIEVNDDQINDAIIQVLQHMQAKHQDLDNLAILASMHERVAGIKSLNIDLKPIFNANYEQPSVTYMYTTFHKGDKVLQIKNDVEQNVYNGDLGIVVDIDTSNKKKGTVLTALFNQQLAIYTQQTFYRLRHGYAMSVHKAQGNEFETVILVAAKGHSIMYNQNLLYTAITRAKKNLIVIGSFEYFEKGVATKLAKRNTTLVNRLQ